MSITIDKKVIGADLSEIEGKIITKVKTTTEYSREAEWIKRFEQRGWHVAEAVKERWGCKITAIKDDEE